MLNYGSNVKEGRIQDMREYRYEDLTHPEPGHGLGARVPSCPGCGFAVILFDDDTHMCEEVAN